MSRANKHGHVHSDCALNIKVTENYFKIRTNKTMSLNKDF